MWPRLSRKWRGSVCAFELVAKRMLGFRRVRKASFLAVVMLSVVAFFVLAFAIDWLVMQIYPLPPGLWERASMPEIIASRPDGAVLANVCGQLLALALVTSMAARTSMGRTNAGVVVSVIVVGLGLVNTLLTRNFRWVTALALPLFVVVGWLAARSGNRTSIQTGR
jgi:hypothetical protein